MSKELIDQTWQEVLEGIQHLDYSYKKVQKLGTDPSQLSSEDLETWEGLIARFGRVSDIYLSKYLRALVSHAEPGFRGSFRDYLDQAAKMKIIGEVEQWIEIRELRNLSVHEYSKAKVPAIFDRVRELTPKLIALKNTKKT